MSRGRSAGVRALAVGLSLTAAAAGLLGLPPATPALAAPAGTPHLPDLQTIVPTDSLSIVGSGSHRQLRYTHLVFNGGAGPLQIQPFYRRSAGRYLGHQQVLTHDAGGTWSVLSSRRIGDAFVYHAEHGHFHFPLAAFGLYRVAASGGPGALVTKSPKNGFCISDSYIYDTTLEHSGEGEGTWGSCTDPTSLRGLSVGGADEYDYRDPGQSVPIAGVRDGRYWFRATSDPNNDFLESDESNNEEDLLLRISNGKVTVLRTREPSTTPCRATLRRPGEGATRRGRITLSATTSATKPRKVVFLVDGLPVVRSASRRSPYTAAWRSGSVPDGAHWVAAQVTGGNGRVCTSPVVAFRLANDTGPDRAGPRVRLTNPVRGEAVRGRVTLSADAADRSGVRSVVFRVDGHQVGTADHRAPFARSWNSRTVRSGLHRFTAVATDRRGNVARVSLRDRVAYVRPPLPVRLDGSVVTRGTGTLTSPALTTRHAAEVLVAFVSYDGPEAAAGQSATVTGGGLTWHLVKRSSSQAGDSEVWAARAARVLHGVTVRATPSQDGFDGMLSVLGFQNASKVGVAAAAGATSGAPSFYVPAVQEGSWVLAGGNDWDGATARVPVASQVLRRQWVDTAAGDTFWVQSLRRSTTTQRLVTVRDTAPTNHRWNYVGLEVVARRR
jgi:hypothetical protein